MDTPTCINYGCNNKVSYVKTNKDGTKVNRAVCSRCHRLRDDPKGLFARHGVKEFKEEKCENEDCTATITSRCQIDLDHIDGNKNNNVPENIQMLCKNCHALKTKENGDHSKTKNIETQKGRISIFKEGESSPFDELFEA